MATSYAVFVEGLKNLDFIDNLNDKNNEAIRRAVNDTVRRAQPLAAREMEKEVNFPRNYLSGANGRLTIAKFATDNDTSAILRGRDRPTSLARFISGSVKTGKGVDPGVMVEVEPGIARRLPRAFAIKLRNNNLGLAVRTSNGRAPKNAYKPKQLAPGLWLIYGPSVDQVFKSVREDIAPDLEKYLEEQYFRQLDLK